MQYLLTIVLILKFGISYTQKSGEYYNSIGSNKHYRFKAIDDSVMELGNVPTHGSRNCTSKFLYVTTEQGLTIFTDRPFMQDSTFNYNCDFSFTGSQMNLIKIENGFINDNDSLLYVRDKDYYSKHHLLVLLNGKKFIMDLGETDGYGLLTKNPKRNRRLEGQLKLFYLNSEKYTSDRYRGYEAYKRFRYKDVSGVWVINSK